MKFHYMGKYDGNPDNLPTREHEEGYVPFKEPSAEKLPIVMNVLALAITVILMIPVVILGKGGMAAFLDSYGIIPFMLIFVGICLVGTSVVVLPHEFLHATCFKGDVYMYTNLKQGLCFVVGPELFSKAGFVIMCMLPNIVFGIIPYIIWLIFPNLWYVGLWGAMAVGMGGGDYMNAFHALVQMPKGAKTYLHGMNSFWIKTDKEIENG